MRTGTLLHFALIILGLLASTAAAEDVRFRAAKPIWPKDREREMNLLVGFRAVIEPPAGEKVVLRVAAATIYRAWINGQFLGCGPARGPTAISASTSGTSATSFSPARTWWPWRSPATTPIATTCWISPLSCKQKWSPATACWPPRRRRRAVFGPDARLPRAKGAALQFSAAVHRGLPANARLRSLAARRRPTPVRRPPWPFCPKRTFCRAGCGIRNSPSSGR